MAALLRPSAAPLWGNCSGSVTANMGAPDIDTEQKREGTAAHWCVEDTLRTGGSCHDRVGRIAPNGVRIDDDMAEAGQIHVDDVRAVLEQYGGQLLVEQPIDMSEIHPENRGTLDTAVAVYAQNRIFLWDFKYGRRRVNARGNLQMIDYAFGLRKLFGIDGNAEQYTRIDIRIIQPRTYKPCGPVDTWSVMLAELRPYWNQLHQKAHQALTDPKCTAGRWCVDCHGLARCDTAAMYSWSVYHHADQDYQINTLTDKQLGTELRNMQDAEAVVKARAEALEQEALHRTKAGKDVGLALQTVPGRIKWNVDDSLLIATFKQLGVEATKPKTLTPKQLIDATPPELKGTAKAIIDRYTVTPSSTALVDKADSISSRVFKN